MKIEFVGVWLLACFAICAGTAAADPLRVLVYHFGYTGAGYATSAYGADRGIVNETTDAGTNGRTGRITVKVQSATGDGGLVVDLIEEIDRQYRPLQTLRCAVYGRNIDIVCDQSLTASAEENVLLSYIGRFFYDGSRLDSKQHWQAVPELRGPTELTNDFTVTGTNGNLLSISVVKRIKSGAYKATSSGTLTYDSVMQIPQSVHLNTAVEGSATYGNSTVDLSLISDSMAHTSGGNSH